MPAGPTAKPPPVANEGVEALLAACHIKLSLAAVVTLTYVTLPVTCRLPATTKLPPEEPSLPGSIAVSYTHLTLPTKRIV